MHQVHGQVGQVCTILAMKSFIISVRVAVCFGEGREVTRCNVCFISFCLGASQNDDDDDDGRHGWVCFARVLQCPASSPSG